EEAGAADAPGEGPRGIVAVVVDPYVNGVHVSLLESDPLAPDLLARAEKCLAGGPDALEEDELADLLYHGQAMLHLHRAVWVRPAGSIHPVWSAAVESCLRRSVC